ncbi:hypothetical protein [Pseudoxanthomonas winnipegensis]|uniref:hypothetical protein n=1 Tax=Pseudoxanthomonas winnipegensis TaxID=2480810 RepID=UPI0030F492C2
MREWKEAGASLGSLLIAVGLCGCRPEADARAPSQISTSPAASRASSDSLVCALTTDAGLGAAEPLAGRGRVALLRQRFGEVGCEASGAADLAGTHQWIPRAAVAGRGGRRADVDGRGRRLSLVAPACGAQRACATAAVP